MTNKMLSILGVTSTAICTWDQQLYAREMFSANNTLCSGL